MRGGVAGVRVREEHLLDVQYCGEAEHGDEKGVRKLVSLDAPESILQVEVCLRFGQQMDDAH